MKSFQLVAIIILSSIFYIGSGNPNSSRVQQQAPTTFWHSENIQNPTTNKYFTAEISATNAGREHPIFSNGYNSFTLRISNLSGQDIEVNWNKTMFIESNNTNGGFMFDGVIYKDRNQQKNPDVIFSGQTFSKQIFPNNKVEFERSWWNMPFSGEVGVYLVANVGKEEIREKILVRLIKR